MKDAFEITAWLQNQVGRPRADVLADGATIAAKTKSAVIEAQRVRGRVTLQSRDVVSMTSRADSRIRAFLAFMRNPAKRPIGVPATDWAVYQAIISAWVARGDMPASALAPFGGK